MTDIGTYPDLAGKVAVLTGSSRGIGAATAAALARNGARVVVNGRDSGAVAQLVDTINGTGGAAIGIVGDATELEALERLRDEAERAFGPVDVLGAFVGGSPVRPGPTADIAPADWQATLDTNLTAPFLALKTFLPGMI